jgi:hypothetical protein
MHNKDRKCLWACATLEFLFLILSKYLIDLAHVDPYMYWHVYRSSSFVALPVWGYVWFVKQQVLDKKVHDRII